MPKEADLRRFADLTFEDFRRMADDESLTRYEKIGFPDEYRRGTEEFIYQDIVAKLPALNSPDTTILDIGPGCSDLPLLLLSHFESNAQHGIFVDSAEMLAQLPDRKFLRKIAAYYPQCDELFTEYSGRINAIICYSVLHYVFVESNPWPFLDKSLALLAPGGAMLIGDIPNISKRRRFFSSEAGIEYHRQFTGTPGVPTVEFNSLNPGQIDDSVVMALVLRARMAGFDAYVVPQDPRLSMANRREDILIFRP